MRALAFVIVVALLFVAGALIGAAILGSGYGIPSSFDATYSLDALSVLAGVGEELGKPVIYEWPVATLLRPGETYINITLLNFMSKCKDGAPPAVIIVYVNGKQFSSNGTSFSVRIERNNIFFVSKIKIIINTNCTIMPGSPLAHVKITSLK